jgi:acetyl esterase/lipase
MARRISRRTLRWSARVGAALLSLLIAATAGTAPATADDGGAPPAAWVTVGYGPEPFQVLDLVVPDAGAFPGPRPLIVYVHSGGWVAGTRSSVPPETLDQVARGYAVATLDYRLASTDPNGNPVNSFPGAIWDVKRAIRFLKTNAATWNLDARRVVLMGASAGGYLAAFVAATPGAFEPPDLPAVSNRRRDSSVRGVVDLVGPTDLVTFQHTDHPWAAPLTASFLGCPTPNGAPTCPDDILTLASVAPYVDRSDPPILLAYGTEDGLVVPATQGAPLARVWLDAHDRDATSTTYWAIQRAGHTLPLDRLAGRLASFFDQVTRMPAATGAL